jgi:hypothetical protein
MAYADKDRQREYHKQWIRKNQDKYQAWAKALRAKNTEYLIAYRLEHGCKDCGYRTNVDALQFDHVRGPKLGSPGNFYATTSFMLREIEKCEVVCANCHAIRTGKRRREGIVISNEAKSYNRRRGPIYRKVA